MSLQWNPSSGGFEAQSGPFTLEAWRRSGKFYWTSGTPEANPPQAVDTIEESKAAAIFDYNRYKETYT